MGMGEEAVDKRTKSEATARLQEISPQTVTGSAGAAWRGLGSDGCMGARSQAGRGMMAGMVAEWRPEGRTGLAEAQHGIREGSSMLVW